METKEVKLYLVAMPAFEYDDDRYSTSEGTHPVQLCLTHEEAREKALRIEFDELRGLDVWNYYHWEEIDPVEFDAIFEGSNPGMHSDDELIIPQNATDEEILRFIGEFGGFSIIQELPLSIEISGHTTMEALQIAGLAK